MPDSESKLDFEGGDGEANNDDSSKKVVDHGSIELEEVKAEIPDVQY